jgi:tight adherence protein C
MVLAFILALVLIGAAFALAARAAALPRMRSGESLGQIGAYGYAGEALAEQPASAPFLPQLADRVGRIAARRRGQDEHDKVRKLLLAAGLYGVSPTTFLGYRVLGAAATTGACVWLITAGHASALWLLLVAVYGPAMGWMLPMLLVRGRARRRLERIELELPELIDLVIVTLEAGLGFTSALQRSAQRLTGPLGHELRLALREQALGLTTERALQNMLERCEAPAVRSFVRAVVQGESLGVSISHVMRELGIDLRKRRRQIVEEKANKAPIKILFPLAFLILPAIFVVLLYPGIHNIITTLAGS